MKFAHFADIHIGSWRDPRLSNVSTDAFKKSVQVCFEKQVDFILISGDFFNTSLPSIDHLKEVVKQLKQIQDEELKANKFGELEEFIEANEMAELKYSLPQIFTLAVYLNEQLASELKESGYDITLQEKNFRAVETSYKHINL